MSGGVEVVGPDHIRDPTTGAALASSARDQLTYTRGGRTLDIFVERDARGITAWLPSILRWTDGGELTVEQATAVRSMLVEAGRRWGRPVSFGAESGGSGR